MPSKRDVNRQIKYVELAVLGDYQFVSLLLHQLHLIHIVQIKEFNLTEDEAVEFMLEAVNIANAMLISDLNVRLSVVYSELWLDAQRVDLHSDIERTLTGTQEYVAGHIYQVEKDTTILFYWRLFWQQRNVDRRLFVNLHIKSCWNSEGWFSNAIKNVNCFVAYYAEITDERGLWKKSRF